MDSVRKDILSINLVIEYQEAAYSFPVRLFRLLG